MTSPISLVNDIAPRSQYTADGSQTDFPNDWPVRSEADLRVIFGDNEAPGIAYTVAGIDDDGGCTVRFVTPPPAGTRITLFRQSPFERQTNYGQNKRFAAPAVNAEFADVVLRDLEMREQQRRTLRLPDSDPVGDLVLPPVSERAGKFAGFSVSGALVALASPAQLVLDPRQYPAGSLSGDDLLLFADGAVTGTDDPNRRATLDQLMAFLAANQKQPFRTAEMLGMAGDGSTDDSFLLQRDMEAMALFGGATYFLRSPVPGGSFYLAGTPRVPSNTSVFWFSPKKFAKDASLTIQGEFAAVSNRDRFKLLEDATQGGSTLKLDTAPHGGGPLSDYWAIGDIAEVIGLRDCCGTPLEQQLIRVTDVNDGTGQLTHAFTNAYAFQASYAAGAYQANYGTPNQTVIRKLVACLATADLSIGGNLVAVRSADIGKLTERDVVMIADDMTSDAQPGAAGSASTLINQEVRAIAASVSGDAAASYRLDGRVEHDFTAAKNLLLIKLNPSTGALISGGRALFAEAPDAAPLRHVFVMRLARGSIIADCDVPNTDSFGRRGNAYRQEACYECGFSNVKARDAKYFAAGEGYGAVFALGATNGWIRGGDFSGMRHSVLYAGATNCHDYDVRISNPRSTAWDCHSQGEAGCTAHDIVIDAGTSAESSPGRAPYAVSIGNTTWLGGSRKCGIASGRIVGFSADSGSTLPAVRIVPGYRDCFVKAKFDTIGQLFAAEDVTGFGTVTGSGFVMHAEVDGVALAKMVDIHGRRNGASVDTIQDVKITVVGRNIKGGISALYVTELEITKCDLDEVTPDASFTYAIEAEAITRLRITRNDFTSFSRGVKLTNCTELRGEFNRFADQANATVLNDAGGNTGIWRGNLTEGFNPLFQSSNSAIAISGRLPGPVDLADDAVLKLTPANTRGRFFLTSLSGASFVASGSYYTATPALDVGGDSSPIVDFATGALTGTTGMDDRITVSIHTDNTIQIENRTGATLKVDGELS